MIVEKAEKLLDLACDALALYIRKTTVELGEGLPLPPASPAAEKAPRKPRAPKPEPETKSPFDTIVDQPTGKPGKASVEDLVEARRRNQEVVGLFIRRYLKASPTGLDRAKAIIQRETPAEAGKKLEEFAYESCVKLTPIFEAELEKAA